MGILSNLSLRSPKLELPPLPLLEIADFDMEESTLNLLKEEEVKDAYSCYMKRRMKESSGEREVFVSVLERVQTVTLCPSYKNFELLSTLCITYLSHASKKTDVGYYHELNVILQTSRNIYSKNALKMPAYLHARILNHSLWGIKHLWTDLIDTAVKEKQFDEARIAQIRGRGRSAAKSPLEESKRKNAVIPADVLDQFVFYVARASPEETAKLAQEELIAYGNGHGVDAEKLSVLQLELQLRQPFPPPVQAKKSRRELRKEAEERVLKHPLLEFIFLRAVCYIDSPQTLANVLLLNRPLAKTLRVPVFRQALMRLQVKIAPKSRFSIWLRLLGVDVSPVA